MTGPWVLFPTRPANTPPKAPMPAATWLSAMRKSTDLELHIARWRDTLKPVIAISNETYRLYSRLKV